jgi:hypothetical protein
MACLVNYVYGLPVLAMSCYILVDIVLSVYFIVRFRMPEDIIDMCTCTILLLIFVKLAILCQFAESERETSRILVQKLLLEDNLEVKYCKELRMLSAQLRDMKIKYTACGFFTLNLPILCSLTGLILSYVIIMSQNK